MKNAVANHLKKRLVELSYPESVEVQFNFEENQSNGVVYIGDLSLQDTLLILERLLLNGEPTVDEIDCLEAFLLIAEEVDLNAFTIVSKSVLHNNHYSEVMSFNDNFEVFNFLYNQGEVIRSGLGDDLILAWVKVCKMIKEDALQLSKQLTCEAERLFQAVSSESKVLEERETANYIVKYSEVPVIDHYDIDVFCEKLSHIDIDNYLNGKSRMTGFMAEVINKKTSETLGMHSIYGVTIKAEDKNYGGFRKEIIHHAIFDAKERINNHAKNAA
ncbi:hypothetical protein [Pseudoalteromonas sp. TAB23]|uniref:hypothetical protein n=1 Tax=Pseudoalteromonas sp. TAB23 TaxID=1938595 RepID=UPI0003FF30FA|nr:hypothetical protein [Pseudoalteromonas sp. TAB23]